MATLGYYNFLKIKKKIGIFNLILEYMKNIYGIFHQGNYIILKNKNFNKNFKKLIVTYAFQNSFDKKGNLQDRYLNVNSKNTKNTIWFVIYLDKHNPKKFASNIILLKKKQIFFLHKLFFFLKAFCRIVKLSSFNVNKTFHYFTSEFNFSNIVLEKLNKLVNFSKLQEIKIPYESQIYQNDIFKFAKKKNNKIKNLAFVVYSAPLQKELFFNRINKIDKLYLINKNMREIFLRYLNWPKEKLKIIKKIRNFNKIDKPKKNTIYLPYIIKKSDIIEKSFESYLNSFSNELDTSKFIIKEHPAPYNSKKSYLFKTKLYKILNKFKGQKKITKGKNLSVVIGGPSSIPIKLIKQKINFIHISNDEENQIYSKKIWKIYNSKKIMKNIFTYNR